jgi:hypothetical protein
MERDFDFQACVHFQDTFYTNYYDFSIMFEVHTNSAKEQSIALERIKFLIYEIFENCIFVNESHLEQIKKYEQAGLRVCTTPEEPYDQIIALLLMLKINAICENKIYVTEIKLKSKLSDNVRFYEYVETADREITKDGWWKESLPNLISYKQMKKNKIVKLVKDSWGEVGLNWKETKNTSENVIFTNKINTENQNS